MTTHDPLDSHDRHEVEGLTDAERDAMAASVEDMTENQTPDDSVSIRLADVKPEPIDRLWPGRVPLGKVTIIAGDGGLGESTPTLDMAATVSTGRPWPVAPQVPTEAGSVVILSAEEKLARLRSQLPARKWEADVAALKRSEADPAA